MLHFILAIFTYEYKSYISTFYITIEYAGMLQEANIFYDLLLLSIAIYCYRNSSLSVECLKGQIRCC